MNLEHVLKHALPLKPGFRLNGGRYGDTAMTIEQLAPGQPEPATHKESLDLTWLPLLKATFRTPFDLNYTLRSLGATA